MEIRIRTVELPDLGVKDVVCRLWNREQGYEDGQGHGRHFKIQNHPQENLGVLLPDEELPQALLDVGESEQEADEQTDAYGTMNRSPPERITCPAAATVEPHQGHVRDSVRDNVRHGERKIGIQESDTDIPDSSGGAHDADLAPVHGSREGENLYLAGRKEKQ